MEKEAGWEVESRQETKMKTVKKKGKEITRETVEEKDREEKEEICKEKNGASNNRDREIW